MAILGVLALLGHFFLAALYGGIGMIMSGVTNAGLTYGTSVRLAVVAMAPAMIVSAVLWAAGLLAVSQIWSLVSVPLTLGYLYFACASAAKLAQDK